jgi:hypothetical protein
LKFCGDDLSLRATAIVILLFFSVSVHAGYDFNFGTTDRSYPLSGTVEADGGYDFLLWGTAGGGSPWYGYLRPHIDGATTLTYSELGASLDFYPLSFLGLRAGGEGVQNDANMTAYDCVSYICRGRFYQTFAQATLTLGAGPFFAQARWRRERWTEGSPGTGLFIEPTAGYALSGMGDSQTMYRATVGLKLNPIWSAAGVFLYYQSDNSHEVSRFPFAIVRWSSGPYSVGVGGGVFSSTIKPAEGSALLILNWNLKPSLALN